jgi:hypothetical protein
VGQQQWQVNIDGTNDVIKSEKYSACGATTVEQHQHTGDSVVQLALQAWPDFTLPTPPSSKTGASKSDVKTSLRMPYCNCSCKLGAAWCAMLLMIDHCTSRIQ